jgi:hypothetical protein
VAVSVRRTSTGILRLRRNRARAHSDHEGSAASAFSRSEHIDAKLPSPEHALAAYAAYVAYFGTYTIDADKHVVIHHAEDSLAPDFTDTDQARPFKLEGDRLEIGDGKTWRRVLERVR